ncbi:MAG: 2-C-methyl-D-erythritol 4-phosphate cytidylyltransferase [bacterium]
MAKVSTYRNGPGEKMHTIALVPAAGLGRRLGGGCPKPYRHIGQRPIVSYPLRAIEECSEINRIVIIVSPEEREFCEREIIPACGLHKPYQLVTGADERQQSVYQGLLAVHEYVAHGEAEASDIVVIHDAARPFADGHMFRQSILEAKKFGACIVGIPVRDTLKKVREEAGEIEETVSRSRLWMAQTPQSFRFDLIFKAHQAALWDGFQGTDDSSLVERLGHAVKMIPGSFRNIKITYPEDLDLAEKWLTEKGTGGRGEECGQKVAGKANADWSGI